MRFLGVTAMATVWICAICGGPAWAGKVEIDHDRMLRVDGERTFVLGLYEIPAEDARLQAFIDSGFNMIVAYATTESLNRIHDMGAYAWVHAGLATDFSEDREQRMRELEGLVDLLANHPALLTWEIRDEYLFALTIGAAHIRSELEPGEQNTLIEALEEEQLAKELKDRQGEALALFEAGHYAQFEAIMDEIWDKLGAQSQHPRLNLSDTDERVVRHAKGLLEGYNYLKQLDPDHPLWINHAPRNQMRHLKLFGRAGDIVGCDIYPSAEHESNHSDLDNRWLSTIGDYTTRMQQSAPDKPVWMILQGYPWDAGDEGTTSTTPTHVPSYRETRFMAYDAIVNGARAIIYWGTAGHGLDTPFMQDLLRLASEIDSIRHVLASPDDLPPEIRIGYTWGSVDDGVDVLAKLVGGETWLIVVNENIYDVPWEGHGLPHLAGTRYRDLSTGEVCHVDEDGVIRGVIEDRQVLVLQPVEQGGH